MSRKSVGIIGLGIIGTRVAQRLRGAGFSVFVFNRSPRPVPNFLGSPAQMVAQCSVIQLFIRTGQDLEDVAQLLTDGGLRERHLVINSATVEPEAVEAAAMRLQKCGAAFVNAPFMGSRAAAEAGQLIYFAGGSEAALRQAQPVLAASSREIVKMRSPREAALSKLAANMLVAAQVVGLAEVLGFVEACGLDNAAFLKALEPTVAASPLMQMKGAHMLAGEYDAHFTLANMLKDARMAEQVAGKNDVWAPLTEATSEILAQGVKEGLGELDFSAVARLFLRSQAVEPVEAPSETVASPPPLVTTPEAPPAPSLPPSMPPPPPRPTTFEAQPVQAEFAEAPGFTFDPAFEFTPDDLDSLPAPGDREVPREQLPPPAPYLTRKLRRPEDEDPR